MRVLSMTAREKCGHRQWMTGLLCWRPRWHEGDHMYPEQPSNG